MADCPGCRSVPVPYGLTVDHLTAEQTPADVRAFIVVGVEAEPRGFPDQLERCPVCATHFFYEHRIDNDIFQPTDESRWERATPERARAWLAAQDATLERTRKALLAFAAKARRRWAAVLPGLSDEQRAIFDFLASVGSDGATPQAIELRICLPSDATDRLIAALVERKLLRETSPKSYRGSRGLVRFAIDV